MLDKYVTSGKGKQLLNALRQHNDTFLKARGGVISALSVDQRDTALRIAQQAALPALDAMQAEAVELVTLQQKIVDETGAATSADIVFAKWLLTTLGAAAAVAGIVAAWSVTRSITRPLARAVEVAERVAQGDLSRRIDVASRDETGQLMAALRHMNESLDQIVRRVRSGTAAIASASGQLLSGNTDLSARTEEQAASLEETASSMEQLTATVRQNADNARQAKQLASNASDIAGEGGRVVETRTRHRASSQAASSKSTRPSCRWIRSRSRMLRSSKRPRLPPGRWRTRRVNCAKPSPCSGSRREAPTRPVTMATRTSPPMVRAGPCLRSPVSARLPDE